MIYVIGIEALIVALFAGVFSESFLIGIGAFVGTFLLYNIPILGQMFGVICSICEAYIAYKLVIMLNWIGTTGGMFFAIILFVVLYYLHNAFFYDIDEIPVEYIGWGWLLSEALLVGMFVEFLTNSTFIGFVGIALTVALVIVSVIPYIRVVGMAFLSVFMGYTTYSVFIGTVEKKNAIIGGLIIFVFSAIMYVYVYKSLNYREMVLRKKYSAIQEKVYQKYTDLEKVHYYYLMSVCVDKTERAEFEEDWRKYINFLNDNAYISFNSYFENERLYAYRFYNRDFAWKNSNDRDTAYNHNESDMKSTDDKATIVYFKGVTSEEGLKKRHRELLKIYHTDNQYGDTEVCQNIQREYDYLKKLYQESEQHV